MKIIVVIPTLHRGGAERVASMLTKEWAQTHTVLLTVFDPSDPAYPYGGQLLNLGGKSKRGIISKIFNALLRIKKLAVLIHKEHPDHIISFMESANFPSIIAAVTTNSLPNLTVSVRDNPSQFPLFYRALIPMLYHLPAQVIAVSSGVGDALNRMHVPKHKIRSIPNPVEIPAVPHSESGFALSVKPARFILAVGRLQPQKGFDRLLDAFARLKKMGIELVILGEGDERDQLTQQALSLGIEKSVHLLGNVDNPTPWYCLAECFVLSSRHEGWPNVLMEAMACGCPIVSFDCDYGPSEIIEHGVSGLLVAEGNIENLADAIKSVCYDQKLRHQLSIAAKKQARLFSCNTLAGRWIHDSKKP